MPREPGSNVKGCGDAKTSEGSINTQSAPAISQNDLYAAVTRSLLRGLALYFSRPVRLFRPVKNSGWTSLKQAAARDGVSLSPSYVVNLVQQHGISVIPRHFIPPLIINSALGTILFATYSATNSILTDLYPSASTIATSAVSGSVAGFAQALAGAPADNVRSLIERGVYHPETSVSGWRHAWKEVFRGTKPLQSAEASSNVRAKEQARQTHQEIREVRSWVKDVREMAGRGWEGWGWGCAKDVLGFGLFFATFDVFRRLALQASTLVDRRHTIDDTNDRNKFSTSARVAQGSVLVLGGALAGIGYEVICRPIDNVRRELHTQQLTRNSYLKKSSVLRTHYIPPLILLTKHILKTQGLRGLFSPPQAFHVAETSSSVEKSLSNPKSWSSRLYFVLRTFARVGPWGVGFLVWQGISREIQ
ncbi:uncharacterized protein EI90DRAFT_3155208 [Cantharellus anzutake]|uniref:uncharacterized protein n=1 Tax=Cantharellus anzutake TaxID=1750568 RepID=UPI001905B53A|nr:uncharacterized protein EI90DRAFT_3155208 [Cantharellus anzutake]KAF8329791.1 hypothetical protein EI90DRAFT_3155208 [Cantharellus anzutake]